MNTESRSILIVDDEELNSEGLARLLGRHGYAVTVAPNGRKALELLGERRFDLVLLDVLMPGMNGLEVLKLLRRVDSLLDLPVIMVTAKGESGTGLRVCDRARRLAVLGVNGHAVAAALLSVAAGRLLARLPGPPPAARGCGPAGPVARVRVVGELRKRLGGEAAEGRTDTLL